MCPTVLKTFIITQENSIFLWVVGVYRNHPVLSVHISRKLNFSYGPIWIKLYTVLVYDKRRFIQEEEEEDKKCNG